MKVTVEKVLLTSEALFLGLVVRGPKGGWVRFAEATVPLDAIPWADLAVLMDKKLHAEFDPEDDPTLW